jgi:predicted DNA-binding protein
MYVIHRLNNMRRTQLYLDERMARTLAALSRQRGATVSQLVRESVEAKYMTHKEMDKAALARQLSGIWRKRRDLKDIHRTIRRWRRGTRLKRLGLG